MPLLARRRQKRAEAFSAGRATDVMVNTSDRQVHPKTEGVDFENAEKMYGVCGYRRG